MSVEDVKDNLRKISKIVKAELQPYAGGTIDEKTLEKVRESAIKKIFKDPALTETLIRSDPGLEAALRFRLEATIQRFKADNNGREPTDAADLMAWIRSHHH